MALQSATGSAAYKIPSSVKKQSWAKKKRKKKKRKDIRSLVRRMVKTL